MKIKNQISLGVLALASLTFACGGGESSSESTSTTSPAASSSAPAKEMSLGGKVSG